MARPITHHLSVGQRFGKLVIESFHGSVRGQRKWNCRCDCGKMTLVSSGNLTGIRTVSCGCRRAEFNKADKTKHGMSHHPLMGVWNTMNMRCHNPNAIKYQRYGARGISVCPEWRTNAGAFMAWALANGWKQGLQIDRIDNDGNYEPKNCHFVTRSENIRNRPYTRRITAFGETKTLVEWCKDPRCKVKSWVLRDRVIEGMSSEVALTTPSRPKTMLVKQVKSNG